MAVVVNLHEDVPRAPDHLAELVAEDLERTNDLLLEKVQDRAGAIPEVARHLIEAGGKRLRPVLTLAAARLCGYEGARHIPLAACVELLHTATLLHDDVVDRSRLRRGRPSANALWDDRTSVLVGDFLFAQAFRLMTGDGAPGILDILSRAAAVISEGEVLQLSATGNPGLSEDLYLEVIRAKTAELFAAACRVGPELANREEAVGKALSTFGMNFGIAFQLTDDVLDYTPPSDRLGKPAGGDFREGKVTLPVILAYLRGGEAERAFWRAAFAGGPESRDSAALEKAIRLLKKHDGLKDSLKRAEHYAGMARDALGLFPESAEKNALIDLANFCPQRGE